MILFHRDLDDVKDPTTHVIFSVKDMAATVTAIRAAGGTLTREHARSEIPAPSSASRSIRPLTALS
jgi:predicted enzyme related to lactoylglutathione lyase